MNPLFYIYPNDPATFGIDLQYFYGPSILVSPVTDENSTSVTAYFPNDIFYDYYTHAIVSNSTGEYLTLTNINTTTIPLHYRGGVIVPQRVSGAMTTAAVRLLDFEIIVPVGVDGTATGELYIDDGLSIEQAKTTHVNFDYNGLLLHLSGTFGYNPGVTITRVVFVGLQTTPMAAVVNGREAEFMVREENGDVVVEVGRPFGNFTVSVQ